MFSLSPAAAAQILLSARQSGCEGAALRVAAQRGADGDLSYGMGFDDPQDDDQTLVFEGVTVLIGLGSQELLAGTQLDFVELEPGQPSFIFIPPPVAADASTGACGHGGCSGCSQH